MASLARDFAQGNLQFLVLDGDGGGDDYDSDDDGCDD